MKLEDQLAAAEARLREAQARLKAVEIETKPARDAFAAMKKEKERERDAANKVEEEAERDARKRLGLTDAAVKRYVLCWAGLKPLAEEDAALVRGKTDVLDKAVRTLIDRTVRAEPDVIAARTAAIAARKVTSDLWAKEREVEKPVTDAERAVRAVEAEIHDIHDRMRKRVVREKPPEDAPVESPADRARFVEARRRIAALAEAGERRGELLLPHGMPVPKWEPSES